MPLRGWGSLVKPAIMKKLFLLPIFALALCFTSCGDDYLEQNQPENPSVSDTKKLVSMESEYIEGEYSGTWYKVCFEYDAKGRVVSYTNESGDDDGYFGEVVEVVWDEKGFSMLPDYEIYWRCKVVNGKIVSAESNGFDENFIYDSSGYLKAVKYMLSDGSEERIDYKWSNGKLISDGHCEYKYSGNTCNGYFPLFHMPQDYLFVAAPQLLGTVSANIPSMLVYEDEDFSSVVRISSCKFDSDGYLKSCIYNFGVEALEYRFVWK